MAFGHESMPTRKYVYGCREFLPRPVRVGKLDRSVPVPPRERFAGHDLAVEQLFKAHKFQNRLVELERARRAAVVETAERMVPMLRDLRVKAEEKQNELDAARAVLRAENSHNRDTAPCAETSELASEAKALWVELYAHRKSTYGRPEVKSALAAVDVESDAAKSAARTAAVADGLYWATSLQVATRVKKTGPEPRFKRWDGEGSISVQFQRKPDKSTPKEPVLDGNGRPRIHPRSGKPMMAHTGGGSLATGDVFKHNSLCWIAQPSEGHQNCTLHFRVGSDGGSPVFVSVPFCMHRDMPDGEVKWAHLMRRRVGTHFKWEVAFDVARAEWDRHPAGDERACDGTVAVALGWRYIDGTVRAGYWVGSDGVSGYFAIPTDLVEQWHQLERLQSIRDELFDTYKPILIEFLNGRELPPEWSERVATLPQWNSPRRLASLVLWWRDNRLPGDDEVYDRMEGVLVRREDGDEYRGWRKQDKHLADWQANMRERLIRWRGDLYRHFAIGLSYQYRSVATAEIDWHEIGENPEPESGEKPVSKTNRAVSACATLRDRLGEYMEPVAVPAAHIVDTCCRCARRVPHPGAGRWIRCERCGYEKVDRAENAARNILSRVHAVVSAI